MARIPDCFISINISNEALRKPPQRLLDRHRASAAAACRHRRRGDSFCGLLINRVQMLQPLHGLKSYFPREPGVCFLFGMGEGRTGFGSSAAAGLVSLAQGFTERRDAAEERRAGLNESSHTLDGTRRFRFSVPGVLTGLTRPAPCQSTSVNVHRNRRCFFQFYFKLAD